MRRPHLQSLLAARREETERRQAHLSVAAMRRERRQEFEARENTRPHVDLDITVEPTREAA